jgi:hypothetical protein
MGGQGPSKLREGKADRDEGQGVGLGEQNLTSQVREGKAEPGGRTHA